MAIEVNSDKAVCMKCGVGYGKRKGYFPTSHAFLYKGTGYLPICKTCVDSMYNGYLTQSKSAKDAVRQMCRKLDLYWNDSIFEAVSKKASNQNVMTQYLTRVNSITYAGKCYDDTLAEENGLWSFAQVGKRSENNDADSIPAISPEIISFWGTGYSDDMYMELEQRRKYYMGKFPADTELDMGTEVLLKQICNLEVNIARDSAAGRPIDRSISTLNTLLGSANLKPTQQKGDNDNSLEDTPFGVWVRRWETKRPIPEPDPELKDVDGVIKYISTWFYGHLGRMLGIKNVHSRLYDEAIERLRVDHPEYDDDDDETLFNDIFSDGNPDEQES